MFCAQCGSSVPPASEVCRECGRQLSPQEKGLVAVPQSSAPRAGLTPAACPTSICDICHTPGEGTHLSAAQVREAVLQRGFNPYALGLVPDRPDMGGIFDHWKNTIVAQDTSDWNLCDRCCAAIRPFYSGSPAPTGKTEAIVSPTSGPAAGDVHGGQEARESGDGADAAYGEWARARGKLVKVLAHLPVEQQASYAAALAEETQRRIQECLPPRAGYKYLLTSPGGSAGEAERSQLLSIEKSEPWGFYIHFLLSRGTLSVSILRWPKLHQFLFVCPFGMVVLLISAPIGLQT